MRGSHGIQRGVEALSLVAGELAEVTLEEGAQSCSCTLRIADERIEFGRDIEGGRMTVGRTARDEARVEFPKPVG